MSEFYPIISGALSGMAAAGALKGPIESLTQIWTLTFGRFPDNLYQKYKIKQAADLEKYAKEVAKNIEKIPEENIKEPKMSVVGPALEASKFYMEEDEIRSMFAKLIASSMDKTQSDNIHPSFVEMIKMLSPLDAQNLYYLYHNNDETISSIRETNTTSGEYTEHFKHIFLGNPECQDHTLIEPSIDNLIRLKLVDVSYTEYKTAENAYTAHLENPLYIALKADVADKINSIKSDIDKLSDPQITQVIHNNKILSDNERLALKESLEKNLFKDVELKQGIIQLTALGRNFCKVCL